MSEFFKIVWGMIIALTISACFFLFSIVVTALLSCYVFILYNMWGHPEKVGFLENTYALITTMIYLSFLGVLVSKFRYLFNTTVMLNERIDETQRRDEPKIEAACETLVMRYQALHEIATKAAEVMGKNIYPKPDVADDHPWAILSRLREELSR